MLVALEAMGLTSYEARALGYLLRHGERTGPDLSREADIPFGRVYDTLNALVERGLAMAEDGRPKRYRAIAPDAIPGRLVAAGRRRLQEEDERLRRHEDELARALAALRPRTEPPSHSYGLRVGEEAGRELLIEATHEATREVVAYLAIPAIQDDDLRLFDAFRQAVARGIHTRLLLRRRDVEYLLTTPYVDQVLDAMLPHLGVTLEVRLSDDDVPPFAALDAHRAVLGVRNPLEPSLYFAVIHVEDAAFAQGLGAKFDAMWQAAVEPGDVLQWLLGRRGGRAVAKMAGRLRRP